MFAGPRDVLAVREVLEQIEPGRPYRIAFVAVAGTAWTLPLYELALMTAEYGRRNGLDLALEVVTAEVTPLAAFGTEASAAVAQRLADAGVRVRRHHARRRVRRRAGSGSSRRARSRPTSPSRCRTCGGRPCRVSPMTAAAS